MEEKVRVQLKQRGPLTHRELKQFTNAKRYGLWFLDKAVKNLSSELDPEILLTKDGKRWRHIANFWKSVVKSVVIYCYYCDYLKIVYISTIFTVLTV